MAPKTAKRPAAAPVKPVKKFRTTAKYEAGLVNKCSLISSALKEAKTFPENVQTMLSSCVLQCLAQPQDARHEYQQQVAGWIYEALVAIEASLSDAAAEAQAKFDTVSGEKPNREAAVSEAEAALQTCKQKFEDAQIASSDADAAQQTAASSLADAQAASNQVEEEGSKLAAQKLDLEKILTADGDYTKWKNEQASKKNSDAFIKSLNNKQFEQALLKAITPVLVKEPATRTEFDLMVLKQFEDCIQKKQSDLDVGIQAAAPKKDDCDAVVKECASKLEAAAALANGQQACIVEATDAVKAGECSLKDARKLLRELAPEIKESLATSKSAASQLSEFKEVPLAVFIELRDRTTPVPEPTPPPEEEEQKDEDVVAAPESEPAEKPVEAVA